MDKIDRLLDAMEHPDRYSDQELESLLADSEVSEVYEMLDKMKSALRLVAIPDIDAEWQEFERSHKKRRFTLVELFTRNIAAGIAIGIASIAAVAAVVGVSVNHSLVKKRGVKSTGEASFVNEKIVTDDTIKVVNDIASGAIPETMVFDNETLEYVVISIAEYYGYETEFSTEVPDSLRLYFRWNQAHALDEVVESLNNFEQIHITLENDTIKID